MQSGISRLILDETNIGVISQDDIQFLSKFIDMKRFSLAQTKLKKLNLPDEWKLESVSTIATTTLITSILNIDLIVRQLVR
jgi:hypothetical protein